MKNIRKSYNRRRKKDARRITRPDQAIRLFTRALLRQKNEVQLLRDLQRCTNALGFADCSLYLYQQPLGDLTEVCTPNESGGPNSGGTAFYKLAMLALANGKRMETPHGLTAIPLLESGNAIGVFCTQYKTMGVPGPGLRRILESLGNMCVLQLRMFSSPGGVNQEDLIQGTALNDRQTNLDKTLRELEATRSELHTIESSASAVLRSPLRAIEEYLDLLARNGDHLSASSLNLIEGAGKHTDNLRMLLDGIAWYNQLAQTPCPDIPVDLGQVLNMACFNLASQIRDLQAELIWCDHTPMLKGHELYLVQLFQNLLSNSLKFQDPGQTPRIEIEWEFKNARWQFVFRDNGHGIAEVDKSKVFDLFHRSAKSKRMEKGMGMGLSFCRRIVAMHGGEIKMVEGPGCAFAFSLPAATQHCN